jgi:hypothetical protein
MWKRLWQIGGENRYGLRMKKTGCRGIFATTDIPAGERILEIPEEHIMRIEPLYERNPLLKKIYPQKQQRNDRMILHVYSLLTGQVEPTASEKIYLSSLPKDYSNFCLFFDKKILKPLKGTCFSRKKEDRSDLFHSIDHYQQYYEDQMDRLGIPPEKRDAYRKAIVIVNSRIFQFQDGRKEVLGLVPIADLLNHSNEEGNTTWYFDNMKRVFVMETTVPIPTGRQVYDSYGNKTDIQLLYTYGFYMPKNTDGEIIIPSLNKPDLILRRQSPLNLDKSTKKTVKRYTVRIKKILTILAPQHPLKRMLTDQLCVLEADEKNSA